MLASRRLVVLAAIAAAVAGIVILWIALKSPPAKVHRAPAAQPTAVRVVHTKLGRILVDQRGRTLYLFLEDRHGKSSCFGGCERVWPPALVASASAAKAGPGVRATKLTTRRRRHEGLQLVYNGHPLYTTVADEQPGQTSGQGFFGTWYVVSPAGHMVGKRPKHSAGY